MAESYTSTIEQSSARRRSVLVVFSWAGGAHVTKYAKWDQNISIFEDTYASQPLLDVTPGQLHGGIEDKPWVITCPNSIQPIKNMIRPYEHAPVVCSILELDPDDLTSLRVVFKGNVTKTTKNKDGFKGLVQVEVSGWKSLIQYPAGLPILTECPWVLGDKNCCVDLDADGRRQSVSVTAIVKPTTIAAPTLSLPGGDAAFFDFGDVAFDGLSIGIKNAQDVNNILLTRPPPPEWVGSTVVFTPGCDKKIVTCRARWDNEERFCGAGIDILDYNPMIGSK